MKNGKKLGKKIAGGLVRVGKGMKEAYAEEYGAKPKKKKVVTKQKQIRKVAPLWKTIAGKRYKRFATAYSNKADAAFMALDLRGETNTNARVVAIGNKYWVYYTRTDGKW